jgi:hypothetical protein
VTFAIEVTEDTTHPSGLTQAEYQAFTGGDGIDRNDIVNVIEAFFTPGGQVGSFDVQRNDVVKMINWFFNPNR